MRGFFFWATGFGRCLPAFLWTAPTSPPCAGDATRIVKKRTLRGKSVDLIEAFVGLVALFGFLLAWEDGQRP